KNAISATSFLMGLVQTGVRRAGSVILQQPMPKKFRQSPSNLHSREESLWSARETAQPLAARMRPQTLEEFVGQEHLLASGKALRSAIETGAIKSMVFWGPPGSGKT